MATQPSYAALQQVYGQQQEPSGFMGLLSSPMGQGLLGAGLGALASRGTTAQAIGRGGLLGLSAFGQAQEQQRNRVLEMAQAKMRDDAYASLKPREGGGFTTDSTAALLRYMTPEQLEKTLNLGRDKFKEMHTVTNADGSKGLYSVNEYGGVQNTGLTNAPEIKTQDLGGKVVGLNAYTGDQAWSADKSLTHAERETARHNRASEGIQYGNLSLSRDRLAFDKEQPRGQVMDTPTGLMVIDTRSGRASPVRGADGAPLAGKAGEAGATREREANDALELIGTAKRLLNGGTTGSYLGAAVDGTLGAFGVSTKGGDTAEQLRALEGALVSKMPKMSGPQSDKDVAMYKQMAGVIGDSTIPVGRRLAALQVVEDIQRRHAGGQAAAPSQGQGRQVVRTGVMNGRKVVQYSDGSTAYAD